MQLTEIDCVVLALIELPLYIVPAIHLKHFKVVALRFSETTTRVRFAKVHFKRCTTTALKFERSRVRCGTGHFR